MKLKLISKADAQTNIDDCLNILEKVYQLKYPAWYRIFEYFQCVQTHGETFEDLWSRKTQLEDYCNLTDIKGDDLCVFELIRGVKPCIRADFLKDGTKHNNDETAAPTVDWLLRLMRAKETTRMVEKSVFNPKASKLSDYKQNQKDKWNQSQSQSGSG